ncbi:MAG TPA: hypothetical protein DHV36_06140 [Desulfobacteraceae bacterium]|nr:hypothetical protein [Desulfobacteraceae bacterium]|tara:strand:+ start:1012 stop:1653 length:642 start_codon:yes stop_codon:yes gene_type:complete
MAQTAKKDEKQYQLYRDALNLFAEYGYKKTTVADVADRLGMTKGNIYFYVKNKKELYHRTIHWALTQWQDHVRSAVAGQTTAPDRFNAMAEAALGYIEGNKVFRRLLIRDPEIFTLDRDRDRFPEANRAARQIIRDILDQGIREGAFTVRDPEAATEYLFSIYMMFLIQTFVYLDKKDFRRIFASALALNLGGLSSPRPPKETSHDRCHVKGP